jgi:hypothetical protein
MSTTGMGASFPLDGVVISRLSESGGVPDGYLRISIKSPNLVAIAADAK